MLRPQNRVFDPPEDNPVQRLGRSFMPSGKRVKDQTFGFDRVFDENTTQAEVYEATTKGLLDSVLDGYNATVFAYGATGCGKTHTITGTAQQPGIIFLTMQEMFERINDISEEKVTEITLSYLEIYNETIRDLLREGAGGKQGLMLREDANQAVSVAGLSSHRPQNVQEVMDMLIRGNAARTQSPTEANATSSRSHAVLQINVAQKDRNAAVNEPTTMATLSIIDLAGSERASATKNRGERLLEGANINKSLLALGSCINALCDPRKKNHIPYRNSKLTRLLKFSLGGNCRTVMIVCVSPSSQHFDETQNTLRYANRAKNIQTKVMRNVYNVDRHVKDYLKKIDEQMNRINELQEQQKKFEEIAFGKFRKTEEKREAICKEGIARIRAAYDHSAEERKERISTMKRLRQVERRIGCISSWIGGFDQVVETREEEEPPKALSIMRKTAQGILVELEGSRQHYHQRLGKNNWMRAVTTALDNGQRQLQEAGDGTNGGVDGEKLHQEVELLKAKADALAYAEVMDQEKGGDAALMQILLSAHFETVAILNQILQMSEQEAVEAARNVLGKLLQSCTEATGQVIKPDGGLQIIEAVPPTRSGTPRKRKQVPLMGPSPLKYKIRPSLAVQVPHLTDAGSLSSSPARASPRRRAKLGAARKGVGVAFGGTPKKKSPGKGLKRGVRWRDDTEDGTLAEFQTTPKVVEFSPEAEASETIDLDPPQLPSMMDGADNEDSSPLPAPPKSSSGRFQAGFLTKNKHDGSPAPPKLSMNLSSEDEASPLREMEANRAPNRNQSSLNDPGPMGPPPAPTSDDAASISSSSDVEKNFTTDKESARKIRSAMKVKRNSSLSGNTARRDRERRRSPTATSGSPPPENGIFSASHARRMVQSERAEALKSVLSPRTVAIVKANAAMPSARRSMAVEGTPREARAPVRVSSIVPGSASGGRPSVGSKSVWR